MLAIALYYRFKQLEDYHRAQMQPRQKPLPGTTKEAGHFNLRMVSLALDNLVAFCVGTTPDEVRENFKNYKLHRAKINFIKDKGKKIFDFDKRSSSHLRYKTM